MNPKAFLVALLVTPTLAATAAELTFELRLEQGRLPADMRLIQVKQGDTVRLRWISDRPLVLHLHGYAIELKVEPGKPAEMTFDARATGRFSVEVHRPSHGGGHTHEAPLAWIEVYPR